MTVESSRMQVPTASPNPTMNVQHEVQKGLQDNQNSAIAAGSANKQVVAGLVMPQPQNTQQMAASQISKGYLDIKV
jgi:hypothetical protein